MILFQLRRLPDFVSFVRAELFAALLPPPAYNQVGGSPMTLSQTLELAIYMFVGSVGKGLARTTSLTSLSGLVAGSTDRDVCDSLIRLADRAFVYY